MLLFSCVTTAAAADESFYSYDELTLRQTVSNTIDFFPDNSNYRINSFESYLELVPEDSYRQEVLASTTDPKATVVNDSLRFFWEDVYEPSLTFTATYTVKTSSEAFPLRTAVPFPIEEELPEDVQQYLQTTEYIDTNRQIRSLAQQLAQGHDDLFLLEHELGSWVTANIAYNLSSVTADANQPSSLVLEQRYGVCDELTNLFISLNRALGIPARFVSGIAYTNSELFENPWGNHGWAEVYFPGHGWVPYDVTYGQYGYLDATHISLEKQVDGTTPSVTYSAYGHSFEFENQPLIFSTEVLAKATTPHDPTSIELKTQEASVGFGSYNLITATITNNLDTYYVQELIMSQTQNTRLLDPSKQSVALKPHESKTLQWLVEVSQDLDDGYIYTFPFIAVSPTKHTYETEFEVRQNVQTYTQAYMEQFIATPVEKTVNLPVSCSGPQSADITDTVTITCTADRPTTFCRKDDCQATTQQETTVTFSFTPLGTGMRTQKVTATQGQTTQDLFVSYQVTDTARLAIGNITLPQSLRVDETISLRIQVDKLSSSNPKDVHISIDHRLWEQQWELPELDQDREFELQLQPASLRPGENTITVTITYADGQGNKQMTSQQIQTELLVETFGEKMRIIAGNVAFWLQKVLT